MNKLSILCLVTSVFASAGHEWVLDNRFEKAQTFEEIIAAMDSKNHIADSWQLIWTNRKPQWGWKFHINVDAKHLVRASKILIPYLIRNKIESKVTGSLEHFKWLDTDLVQKGKIFTVYVGEKIHILEDIERLIKDELHAVPRLSLFGDAAVGESGLVSARFTPKDLQNDSRLFPIPELDLVRSKLPIPVNWTMPGTRLSIDLSHESFKSWIPLLTSFSKLSASLIRDKRSIEEFKLVYLGLVIHFFPINGHLAKELSSRAGEILAAIKTYVHTEVHDENERYFQDFIKDIAVSAFDGVTGAAYPTRKIRSNLSRLRNQITERIHKDYGVFTETAK